MFNKNYFTLKTYSNGSYRLILNKNCVCYSPFLSFKRKVAKTCRDILSDDDIENSKENSKKNYKNNLVRSMSTIRDIIRSNDFNFFGTITINSSFCNRYSLSSSQELLKSLIKSYKRKFPSFKFIYITEKHLDGAFHFHGAFYIDINNSDLVPFTIHNSKNNKFYHGFSSPHFNKIGRNFFELIKDKDRLSSYISKYLLKSPIKSINNQLYFCSRGLSRATKEYLYCENDDLFKFMTNFKKNKCFENSYCYMLDFKATDLNSKEFLIFENLKNFK